VRFYLVVDIFRTDDENTSQGQFQESLPPSEKVVGATKWCVFKRINPSRSTVVAAVHERLERMRTKRVDLLQVNSYLN
jgi:aryl-alcohol dehydrogenase-like predicted oxidoreductase